MLLTIVSAIVSTLVKHVTNCVLDNFSSVKIEGAPSWYMKPVDGEVCVYTYDYGDYSSVDRAKTKARMKMIKKVNGLIDVVIYENAPKFNQSKEIELMNRFKKDDNINLFIDRALKYEKVEYYKDKHEAFVRACIPSQILIAYEKNRLENIRKQVVKYKSDEAFDELEGGVNDAAGTNDAFDELEESTKN